MWYGVVMLGKKEVDRKLEGDKNGGMGEEGIRREKGRRGGKGEGEGEENGGCEKEGEWGKGCGMGNERCGIGGNRADVRNPGRWKGKSNGGF